MNSIRFIKIRDVKNPTRGKDMYGNAGIDFFVPNDLTFQDLVKANEKTPMDITQGTLYPEESHQNEVGFNSSGEITIAPHSRVIIPSGIKVLIDPYESMLQANNKSGVATRKGLVIGASVVDSNYTGEIHISVINTTEAFVDIYPGEKLVQFIHIPVYLTQPQEISQEGFMQAAKLREENCGRGENWQGSTDTK